MNIGAPQIIWIILITFGVGVTAVKHGEPQSNYNFWTTLISLAINLALLIWGGFFG